MQCVKCSKCKDELDYKSIKCKNEMDSDDILFKHV